MAVAHHHFGVGSHIDQHDHVLFLVHPHGQKVGGHVGADVTTDQRPPVDVGPGMDSQSQVPGLEIQNGVGSFAPFHFQLGDGLVRFFADGLDVKAETQVTHGGVPHDDDLVDLAPRHARHSAQLPDLVVEPGDHRVMKLSPIGSAIIGNPAHDVASAESLRVFERGGVQDCSTFKIHQIEGDGRRPQVDRKAVDPAPVGIDGAAVKDDVLPFQPRQGLDGGMAANRLGQDPGTTAQQGKFDGGAGVQDPGLTGQAIVLTEELLGLGGGGQRFPAPDDLDDALVTLPAAAAGGGDPHSKVVGVVENRPAGHQVQLVVTVVERRHDSAIPRAGETRARLQVPLEKVVPESGQPTACDPSRHGLLDLPGIPIVQIVASGAERQPFGTGTPGLVSAPEPGGAAIPGILVGAPPFGYEVGRFADLPVDLPEAIHAGFEFRLIDRLEFSGQVCSRHWPASVGEPP